MKKRSICVFIVLLIAVSMFPFALAEGQDTFLFDQAGLLTDEQVSELNSLMDQIGDQYGCAVYAVTVTDYTDYVNGDVRSCAEAFFTANDFGSGNDKSGVLLLLSMAERDYALIAHGYGNTAFTDYGKGELTDYFLGYFANNDWYGGFYAYADGCRQLLEMAANGTPLDVPGYEPDRSVGLSTGAKIAISVVVGCVIAGIVCLVMMAKMKSVSKALRAERYAVDGSLDLIHSTEVFSHVTQTRVKIESDSNRSSGGGGTTVNSNGFSGTSGKF